MLLKYWITLLLIISFFTLFTTTAKGQVPTQTIRGSIVENTNNQPIANAGVEIVELKLKTVASSNGTFRFDNVPVNRYQVKITYVGKETLILPVLLESGKELILEVALESTPSALDTILVKAPRATLFHPLSTQTLTIEETFRYPATFYDPARLVTLYAGVANVNNQGNALSVRGNSPNNNIWKLEGVEIVNPNHTPNAGTFSDKITQSSGGVNILSAQMLGYSNFLTGAFPAQYGNVLGGVLDMYLRKGNNEQHEFIGQIGLIGIDFAAEGPLSTKSGASYLANYRYSTIGLLSNLGVDVGDEKISFQDLSVNLNFPTQKAGNFMLFGIIGQSENTFETIRDTLLWEENKDRFDILFDSRTTVLGGTHTLATGRQGLWKTTVVYSNLNTTRTANLLDNSFQANLIEQDELTQSKFSLNSYVNQQLTAQQKLTFGITATQHNYDILSNDLLTNSQTAGNSNGILLQPYLNWQMQWNNRLTTNAGLTYARFTLNDAQSIEPRLSVNYQLQRQQRLSFAYGLHSQLQLPQVYFTKLQEKNVNKDLGFTKAHHLVAAYQYTWQNRSTLTLETYYQHLFNIPISKNERNSFSTINLIEGSVNEELINAGSANHVGLEVTWQQILINNYYFLLNTSLYNATYKGSDNIVRDTRFNGNYIFNTSGGKEWMKQKKGRQNILGLNLNIAYLGGFRETPIDIPASKEAQTTIFVDTEAFTINQPDYFKIDFRLYYKRNKTKTNTTLALDIQNLTNQQNQAFSYYDAFLDKVIIKYQLGLIPILNWRIEF